MCESGANKTRTSAFPQVFAADTNGSTERRARAVRDFDSARMVAARLRVKNFVQGRLRLDTANWSETEDIVTPTRTQGIADFKLF
jgi:hypothetical protein